MTLPSDFFFRRAYNPQVHETLEFQRNKNSRELDNIINLVFSHQKAVYDMDMDIKMNADEKKTAKLFYKNYYAKSKVKKNGIKNEIEIEEFIEDIFLDKSKENKNKLCFLLGNVGVGKTSYLNNIITNQERYKLVENGIWFVRLDFEKALKERYFKPQYIINQLIEKCKRVIDKRFFNDLDNDLLLKYKNLPHYELTEIEEFIKNSTQDCNVQAKLFQEFIESFYNKTEKKLSIIIDNIDVVYHKSIVSLSRYNDGKMDDNLIHLIFTFLHDHGITGMLYANVLFIMRNDSFNYIKSVGHTSFKQITEHPYRLIPHNWENVVDIRYNMLVDQIKSKPDEQNTTILLKMAKEIQDYIREDVYSGVPLIRHIREMTNYGLRDLINFFNKYSWVSYNNFGMNRLIDQYHIGLISYFLGGNKIYDESESDFPNFFSVNPEISGIKRRFPQTYWLKYLIIKYLYEYSGKEEVNVDHIYNIFGGEGNTDKDSKYYDLELVKEVVECLGNANKSNVIRIKKRFNGKGSLTTFVDLTLRGKYIIENFVFKFIYLQLIVDDQEMRLPRIFKDGAYSKYFNTSSKDYPDYSYILESNESFIPKAKEMITHKSHSVIYFLFLLQGALYSEMERYKSTFAKLEKFKVKLPNIKSIIENHIPKELRAINNTVKFTNDVNAFVNKCTTEQTQIETYVMEGIKND
ncbi:MAG: hypothetical protein GQ564_09440 [Bacteroidales bacterium]|nr:hypothetical protein [Bacteroidales bacterium]